MARPREYDDALRVRLIETAARLLAEEGPHALSTRRIAAESDTSTTAIYSLIGSKEGLVREMYREGFGRLAAKFEHVAETDDPVEDLAELGRAYHEMALENPELYTVMFDCPIPEFEVNDEDRDVSYATLRRLIDAVQRCIDAGLFVGDAWDLSLVMWAMSHGFAKLSHTGFMGDADESRRRLQIAMEAMHRSLVADAASVRS